eukprot:11182308-Lingulodinium_polyedra.AAC.1
MLSLGSGLPSPRCPRAHLCTLLAHTRPHACRTSGAPPGPRAVAGEGALAQPRLISPPSSGPPSWQPWHPPASASRPGGRTRR